jgi:dihydrofolate reductase
VRRIRYRVAASLDGYIAGPRGEADWITTDPDIDFAEMFSQFDTFLIGRGTFQEMVRHGRGAIPGMKVLVFSRTLRQHDYPDVTILPEASEKLLTALRRESGKDIWLFGGGSLFRSMLEMRMVDTVEIAVMPVLLGAGIPLLPSTGAQTKLRLTGHRVYKTGIVSLEYAIDYPTGRKATKKPRRR